MRIAADLPLLGVLALLAASCGSLTAPFEGVPPAPEAGVEEAGPRVAICYGALFSTPEKIRAAASDACGAGTSPLPVGQDMRLTCPLLTPMRATFVCVPE